MNKVTPVHSYFEHFSQAILICDSGGVLLDCNECAVSLLGYGADNFLNRPLRELVAPGDRDRFAERFLAAQSGNGLSPRIRLSLLHQNTTPIPLEIEFWNIDDKTRQQVGVLLHTLAAKPDSLAEALRESAAVVNSTLDLDEVMDRILDSVGRVVPHETANIMIAQHGVLRVVGSRGYSARNLKDWISKTGFPVQDYDIWGHPAPTIIRDTHNDRDWRPLPETRWIRSHLNVPITLDEEIIGYINLDNSEPDSFTQDHAETLLAFSHHAATAIKNARLFRAEHDARTYAEALVDTISAIISTLDPDEVMSKILDALGKIISYDTCGILLLEDGRLRSAGSRGFEAFGLQDWIDNLEFDIRDNPVWQKKIHDLNYRLYKNTQLEADWFEIEETGWVRSHLSLPIVLEGEVIGFINLDSAEPNHFTEEQAQRLLPFSYQASNAIKNAGLFTAEREQRRIAELLHQSTSALTKSLDPDEVLSQIIERISLVIPPADATVIMFVEGDEILRGRVFGDEEFITKNSIIIPRMKVSQLSHLYMMYQTRQPIAIPDTRDFSQWGGMSGNLWVRSYIGTPLVIDETVIGFITIGSVTPGRFNAGHAEILRQFANPAAVAISNARLYTELHRERAQLQAILDKTGEGIIYTEGNRIVYVNDALCKLTGYTLDELIGKPIRMLRSSQPSSAALFDTKPLKDTFMSGQQVEREEVQLAHQNGSLIDTSVTISYISPLSKEGKPRAVVLVRDIRQEKRLHIAQMRFITHAAHELRNPISNIVTRLYLLGRSPDNIERHVAILDKAASRLTTLAEHMSLIAEFDLGNVRLEKINANLRRLLSSTIESRRQHAHEKQIDLTVSWDVSEESVPVDSVLLTQILRLLLTNAILYTPEKGFINLYIGVQSGQIVIEVRDNRPHIPQEEIREFFQPFYTPSEGAVIQTGLELTIVKLVVDLYDGDVTVENVREGGVAFSVKLPLLT